MTDTKYDVIIIGGGLAGLSAASHLAKAGKNVILFEQQGRPGGYCTSFERQGIVFNPGSHWTTDPDKMNRIFEELGVPGIKFSPMKAVFRAIGPAEGSDILLTGEAFAHTIAKSFPSVKKASVDQFIELSAKIDDEMLSMKSQSPELMSASDRALSRVQAPLKLRTVLKYGNVAKEKFLWDLFPGDALEGLRDALNVMVPLSGAPAAAMLAWASIGLKNKAVVPEGGVQRIASALAAAAQKYGVKIYCEQKVNKIKVRGGRVYGVTMADNREYEADCIISAMDARQTFTRLINPEMAPQDYRKRLNTPVTASAFTVSIISSLDPRNFGFDGSDVYFCHSSYIREMENIDDVDKVDFRLKFPTLIDLGARTSASTDMHAIQVVVPAAFQFDDNWATGQQLQRGREYRELKKSVASRLIKRVEKYIPGLNERLVLQDIATPITYHRYTLNHQGASMGWRHFSVWTQKIPFLQGLYCAGHWVNGVTLHGAIASGKTASELILRGK